MNAVTLADFAVGHGLTYNAALRLVRLGRVLGATQDGRTRRWVVFPPAKLLPPLSGYTRRSKGGVELVNEDQQDARRPRTQTAFWDDAPSVLTGFPSYYADPCLLAACRRIMAAFVASCRASCIDITAKGGMQ